MRARKAMKVGHALAYLAVQALLDRGTVSDLELSEQDQERVTAALDELAQRHFDQGADDWLRVRLPQLQQDAVDAAVAR